MSKHRKTQRAPIPMKLSRAVAIGAVAGSAVAFGALFTDLPAANADTHDGNWWLLSGNNTPFLNDNPLVIGNNGNGITNQNAIGTGNIANGQLNLFSLGIATVVNAAPALGGAAI